MESIWTDPQVNTLNRQWWQLRDELDTLHHQALYKNPFGSPERARLLAQYDATKPIERQAYKQLWTVARKVAASGVEPKKGVRLGKNQRAVLDCLKGVIATEHHNKCAVYSEIVVHTKLSQRVVKEALKKLVAVGLVGEIAMPGRGDHETQFFAIALAVGDLQS